MAIKSINVETLQNWKNQDNVVIVDVREQVEFNAVHIEDSLCIPLTGFNQDQLPPHQDKKMVLLCNQGGRSSSACEKVFKESPDTELYILEGGIKAWSAKGFDTLSTGKKILPLDRQVQLTIGLSLLLSTALGQFTNPLFFIVPAFLGLGLAFAGISGFCGLAVFMAKMPWNRVA